MDQPLFTVDETLCRRDGLCAAACPASLVRQDAPDALPYPLPGKAGHCIRCGHCVAICPTGALRHSLLSLEDFPLIDRKKALPPAALAEHLKTRRSIRTFREEAVPRETFAAILDTARFAPTGHNRQEVQWTILDGRRAVHEFLMRVNEWMRSEVKARTPFSRAMSLAGAVRAVDKGKDVVTRGAPHAVFAHVPDEGVTPMTDAIIATTWFEIVAHAHGVGTCFAGYLMFALEHKPEMARCLGIPEGRTVPAALLVGTPKYRYRRMVPRDEPKAVFLPGLVGGEEQSRSSPAQGMPLHF